MARLVRNPHRSAYRPACRIQAGFRSATRNGYRVLPGVRAATRWWSRPNPAVALCRVLKQLLKTPRPSFFAFALAQMTDDSKNRSENGQFWTDPGRARTPCEPSRTAGHDDAPNLPQPDCAPNAPSPADLAFLHYQQLLDTVAFGTEQVRKQWRRVTLTQLASIIDLASLLGRRAVELPTEPESSRFKRLPPAPGYLTVDEALEKIYGSDPPDPTIQASPGST